MEIFDCLRHFLPITKEKKRKKKYFARIHNTHPIQIIYNFINIRLIVFSKR